MTWPPHEYGLWAGEWSIVGSDLAENVHTPPAIRDVDTVDSSCWNVFGGGTFSHRMVRTGSRWEVVRALSSE